jgi:hypothetical protein
MSDSKTNWHQKIWVRVVVLLLLPLVAGGLYLVTTRISLNKPASEPDPLEESVNGTQP